MGLRSAFRKNLAPAVESQNAAELQSGIKLNLAQGCFYLVCVCLCVFLPVW